jgi:protein SCO1/2
MTNRRTILLFALVVFVLPVTAWSLLNLYEKKLEKLPVLGKTKTHRIEDFSLVNQDGHQRGTANWENKIAVVNFFFTHCPVVCPSMTNNLKKVNKAYENNDDILFNSISVDPDRDNPEQLKAYARRFQIETSKWELLTGNKQDIYKLARNSFMVVATDGDGGPDDFIHSERLVLVDQQRRIRGYYNGTSEKETDQLITDIKKLKNER